MCSYVVHRGLPAGIYETYNSNACHFVAHNCKANIIVVENQTQLYKIFEVKCCSIIVNCCNHAQTGSYIKHTTLIANDKSPKMFWLNFIKIFLNIYECLPPLGQCSLSYFVTSKLLHLYQSMATILYCYIKIFAFLHVKQVFMALNRIFEVPISA